MSLIRWINQVILDLATWFLGLGFGMRALARRGRSTHTWGVGARGTFTVTDDLQLPANNFFQPGRTFPVQIRHANAFRQDDASKNFRSIALKLSNESMESPLDLIMNTGEVAGFWHTANFYLGVLGALGGRFGRMMYQRFNPPAMANVRLGAKRAPGSFTRLYYYTNVVFHFDDVEGERFLVKFRVAPEDLGPEDGEAVGDDAKKPWLQNRLKDDTRPLDYLRREFLARFERGDRVRYRLQARVHKPSNEDGNQIYNIAKRWHPETHPWLDVGMLELNQALTKNESESLRYRIFHLPENMAVPPATSIFDYRSIGYMRTKVYPRLQGWRLRQWRRRGEIGPGGFPDLDAGSS